MSTKNLNQKSMVLESSVKPSQLGTILLRIIYSVLPLNSGAAIYAAQAWFDRRFKNHWLLTRAGGQQDTG